MAKVKTSFACSECGNEHPRWQGQCGNCQSWNCITEVLQQAEPSKVPGATIVKMMAGYSGTADSGVSKLSSINSIENAKHFSNIAEFDRVCGNGITDSSVNLFSGDPGSGKTTLLSAVVGALSFSMPCLYVTAEESNIQFKNRMVSRLYPERCGAAIQRFSRVYHSG
jgi:DNA repair protein RadA/Sms